MSATVPSGLATHHQLLLLLGRGVRRSLRPSGTTLPLAGNGAGVHPLDITTSPHQQESAR
jgi:hypothetical protein